MEFSILTVLEFNITIPTALKFLDRYKKLLSCDEETYFLARYVMELCLCI